jgi:flagellar biosynthesis regulator FlaF
MDKTDNLELTAQLVLLMEVLASQFAIAPTEHLKFTADLDSQSAMERMDPLDLAARNSQSVMERMENLLFTAELAKKEISQFAMDQTEPKELTAQLHSFSVEISLSQFAMDQTESKELTAHLLHSFRVEMSLSHLAIPQRETKEKNAPLSQSALD